MAALSSGTFHENVRAWLRTVFPDPEHTYIYGFHPCELFLRAERYCDPYTNPNIGPRFLGGDYAGCWTMAFTTQEDKGIRWWAQHGENAEHRRSFEWQRGPDAYEQLLGGYRWYDVAAPHRLEDDPICQWVREVHQYISGQG